MEIATKIGELQHSSGLDIQVEDYVDEFNFDLMDVVFEWARGVKVSKHPSCCIRCGPFLTYYQENKWQTTLRQIYFMYMIYILFELI